MGLTCFIFRFLRRPLLAFAASIGATVARIVAQPEMHR